MNDPDLYEHPRKGKTGGRSNISFASVIGTLRKNGSADGFRDLRDFLLSNYDKFRIDMRGAANVISLAIACDKHATFADIAKSKVRDKQDLVRWDMFQKYLNGDIERYDNAEPDLDGGEDDGTQDDEDE